MPPDRTTEEIIRQLETLKESIEDTKTAKAQAEGKLEAALDRLKTEFELDDEVKAEERIRYLEEEESRLTEQLKKRYSMLKEKYEWE